MSNIRQDIQSLLNSMAERLRELKIPEQFSYVSQIERLVEQIEQPGDVAVMGQVKAGKSTFVNAYLEQDLALVGTEETTATLNYFRHMPVGNSEDIIIKCHWRNGNISTLTQQEVNAFQGHDEKVLRIAEQIKCIEYLLNNSLLEKATLIDTPGSGAVVGKHTEKIDEMMQRKQRLREEHDKTTREIGTVATALIYLIKNVPKENDKDFLEEFQQLTSGPARAFNTIGVLGKIDENEDRLNRRYELSDKIAHQLKDNLNTVVPVSAGLQRALQGLLAENEAGLRHFITIIRRIPTEQLPKMLKDSDLFLDEEIVCPVSLEEREQLLGTLPWGVFKVIARIASDASNDQAMVKKTLIDLAGFERLRAILQSHFFDRSDLLRSHSALQTARRIVQDIRSRYLQALILDKEQEKDFRQFIERYAGNYQRVAQDLKRFIEKYMLQGDVLQVTALVEEFERELDVALLQLQQYSEDFATIQQISQTTDLFTAEEKEELQKLLGHHGLAIEKRLDSAKRGLSGQNLRNYVIQRQIYWRGVGQRASNTTRRQIAQSVATRYGYLLNEMSKY